MGVEQRAYRDYDDTQELGHAQHQGGAAPPGQVCARGHELELDLPDTIRSTAANAGYLDIKMVPRERHNNVKVLLLMDVAAPWTNTSSAWKNSSAP